MSTEPIEPLSLFDDSASVGDECQWPDHKPLSAYQMGCRCGRCRCERSSYNRMLRSGGPRPCKFPGCDRPRRRVQAAKYCEEHSTSIRYGLTGTTYSKKQVITCACCGAQSLVWKTKRYPICAACTIPVQSLIENASKHKVPWSKVQRWMETKACDLCGGPINLAKSAAGRRWTGTIDHDHSCCSGHHGCAGCVRGMLCGPCNMALGMTERIFAVATVKGVLSYLGRDGVRFSGSTSPTETLALISLPGPRTSESA